MRNRINNRLLAERVISPNRPILGEPTAVVSQSGKDTYVEINWTATDADNDSLTHFVQIAPNRGAIFWPVAHALDTSRFRLKLTPDVPRGSYIARVLSSDGVNVESRDVLFTF